MIAGLTQATAGSAAAEMAESRIDAAARPGESRSLRIVIGENNADLALTLGLLLNAEPDMLCVATGATAGAVLSAVDEHLPNAFILDLSLDDGPSLPLISKLRERLPVAVIVVFTGHSNTLRMPARSRTFRRWRQCTASRSCGIIRSSTATSASGSSHSSSFSG